MLAHGTDAGMRREECVESERIRKAAYARRVARARGAVVSYLLTPARLCAPHKSSIKQSS